MKKMISMIAVLSCIMISTSFFVASASNTAEESEVPKLSEQIDLPIQFVDQNGNPVLGLTVSEPSEPIYSSVDGRLKMKADPSKLTVFSVCNPISEEDEVYQTSLSSKEKQLVWEKQTPSQSVEQIKEKIKLCVVDQNEVPVPDAVLSFHNQCTVLPTNKQGETYYFHQPLTKERLFVNYIDNNGYQREKSFYFTVTEEQLTKGNFRFIFRVKM